MPIIRGAGDSAGRSEMISAQSAMSEIQSDGRVVGVWGDSCRVLVRYMMINLKKIRPAPPIHGKPAELLAISPRLGRRDYSVVMEAR